MPTICGVRVRRCRPLTLPLCALAALQYLQYKNVRPTYLEEIWKIVNWKDVAERFSKAS